MNDREQKEPSWGSALPGKDGADKPALPGHEPAAAADQPPSGRPARPRALPESDPADAPALWTQLEALHPASFGWALSCCRHEPTEAEEVLQTAYLKVLQGRARYSGRAALKTWFFAVIRHTAADQRRRHWLRRLRLTAFAEEHAADCQPPEHRAGLERDERQQLFETALARLPRRQREVLHLVFYQDLSLQQAAEAMGVSVGSARTHYARGKAQLRGWLTSSGSALPSAPR